jgi:hypothetical protein
MPRYVIERDLAGAGALTQRQLQLISRKSRDVLVELGPDIQWIESYVTPDKLYCIYTAPDEALILEHALRGGFPATRVSEVVTMISPATAEAVA